MTDQQNENGDNTSLLV